MRNLRVAQAAPVNRAAAQTTAIRELLFLSCTVFRGGPAEIQLPALHFPGRPRVQTGIATPYSVELLDVKGRTLESQRLLLDDPHRTLDDAVLDFSVAIPWRAEAAQIVVRRGSQTLDSVAVEKRAPTVKLTTSAQLEAPSGRIPVRWRVTGASEAVSLVRYSNDGGAGWIGLAANLTATELEVDFDQLPGSKRCLLQILTSAGVRTGVATSEPFVVPVKPRRALVVAPRSGVVVLALPFTYRSCASCAPVTAGFQRSRRVASEEVICSLRVKPPTERGFWLASSKRATRLELVTLSLGSVRGRLRLVAV